MFMENPQENTLGNSSDIKYIIQTPVFHTPPVIQTPKPPKPKMGMFGKIFISLLVLIIIALAIIAYIYRYDIFESNWRHSMNNVEEKYQTSSAELEKKFAPIDNLNFLQTASSSVTTNNDYVVKINDVKSSMSGVQSIIDDGLKYTDASQTGLSADDETVRGLYAICYEGRKKGGLSAIEALQNTAIYVKAYTFLQNYNSYDLPKLKASFTELSSSMVKKDLPSMVKNIPLARADILKGKADLDSAYSLLGIDAYKQESSAYQLFLDALDDIASSTVKKDVALVTSGGLKMQQAGVILQESQTHIVSDLNAWLNGNVTAKYKDSNDQVAKVNDTCAKAESESKLSREKSRVNMFVQKVRGL